MATRQLMRFEEEERKKLDKRKLDEKQAAINEVFRNNDEKTGKFQKNEAKFENESKKWEEKGVKAL